MSLFTKPLGLKAVCNPEICLERKKRSGYSIPKNIDILIPILIPSKSNLEITENILFSRYDSISFYYYTHVMVSLKLHPIPEGR